MRTRPVFWTFTTGDPRRSLEGVMVVFDVWLAVEVGADVEVEVVVVVVDGEGLFVGAGLVAVAAHAVQGEYPSRQTLRERDPLHHCATSRSHPSCKYVQAGRMPQTLHPQPYHRPPPGPIRRLFAADPAARGTSSSDSHEPLVTCPNPDLLLGTSRPITFLLPRQVLSIASKAWEWFQQG